MITAGVLLAAGESQRYGENNKLLSEYQGRPLVTHAAAALRDAELDVLVAVVADEGVAAELDGFHLAWIRTGESSKSRSLKAGIVAARERHADRVLIALGDMPAVGATHLRAVADRCTIDSPSATYDGSRAMVPACFPASSFTALLDLDGDIGARPLLRNLPRSALVRADEALLLDIDHQAMPRFLSES
jgi:molybdenum cofactor cytidylyltransferase